MSNEPKILYSFSTKDCVVSLGTDKFPIVNKKYMERYKHNVDFDLLEKLNDLKKRDTQKDTVKPIFTSMLLYKEQINSSNLKVDLGNADIVTWAGLLTRLGMIGMNVLEEEINICAQMYNGVIFLDTVSFKEGLASTIASDSLSNDSLMSEVNLPIKEEKLQVGQMDENKVSDDSLDNRKPSSIAYGNTTPRSAHFSSPKVNLAIKNEKSQMGHMDEKKVTVVPDSLSNIQKASSNVKPNIIACKPPPVKKDDARLKHDEKMLHMGHMFENKITVNADNSTNGQNPVIIANKHKNAQLMVFEHNGEKMNVFYDSEIDALTEKGGNTFIEIKTHIGPVDDSFYTKYHKGKRLWLQCYLSGIKEVIVGLKKPKKPEEQNEEPHIVSKIDRFNVDNIGEESKINKDAAMKKIGEVLFTIKKHLSNKNVKILEITKAADSSEIKYIEHMADITLPPYANFPPEFMAAYPRQI